MIDRMEKIDELIRREVSKEIFERFPGEIISVTKVLTSRDLECAKVWVSVHSSPDKSIKMFQNESNSMMQSIFKRQKTKKIPKLQFVLDQTGDSANRIEHLIESLHNK